MNTAGQSLEEIIHVLEAASFNEREDAVQALLHRMDFYQGQSQHALQLALSLPLPSIRLARLSCDTTTLIKVSSTHWMDVTFSEDEERRFARFQIACNQLLKQRNFHSLPLLHLTPRLVLNPVALPVILETAKGPKKGKKKTRRKKKVAAEDATRLDIEVLDSDDHEEEEEPCLPEQVYVSFPNEIEQVSADSERSSSTPRRIHSLSIPKEKLDNVLQSVPPDSHQHVEQLCEAYEEQLSLLRDHYDAAIQSLNLRLYIANSQIENLTDEMAKKL